MQILNIKANQNSKMDKVTEQRLTKRLQKAWIKGIPKQHEIQQFCGLSHEFPSYKAVWL